MATDKKSKQYRDLIKRINELEKHFIKSFKTKNIPDFTLRQMDLARGFRVLCHAEIEAYFEDVARYLLIQAKKRWDRQKKVNITVAALFANFERIEKNIPLNTKINQVIRSFEEQRIKSNHGIKEENLIKLFVPLGIDKDEFDSTWLSTIDSYGAGRGNTAHTSARTQQPIDLGTEIQTLNYILQGIEQFEVLVKRISV
ncbi:HEPN domain-containing protein [Ruminiclostridium cellobioparum]|uniref:RiboL-PSP-HEPN domain-containing protein n=1 Tax=Ruminiclostridium cellobioparum subsp. termitidis CT1112 TaxID=1195236 RepID=S0FN31_RUMCE|nr:HEPN domain-containing protein [Ruminiclostridium cellobioparum]EMS70539.1 hypothetical protein CTER_3720 [Ruminiclostridium cellobioparum subsp. termitidis CT1112]